jgi:hypothetical protein
MDSYEDIDTKSVAAEIGAELFASSEPESPVIDTPVVESAAPEVAASVTPSPEVVADPANPAAPSDPAAPAVVPGVNSESLDLPKSWRKEMATEWTKASPEIKAYVRERESQVMRGINQYQAGYQAWDNLIKPFAPVLEANPDVNPIVLMQGLMATHLHLLDPNTDSTAKSEMAVKLLAQYGINLDPAQQTPENSQLIARLQKAEQTIANIAKENTLTKQQAYQAGVDAQRKIVDAFEADPKNKYFSEVSNDILRFVANGTAADLQSAYDLACWANPAVRAKMLAEQQAVQTPSATPKRDGKNGRFINLDGEADGKSKSKPISIDNTIDSIVNKHFSSH